MSAASRRGVLGGISALLAGAAIPAAAAIAPATDAKLLTACRRFNTVFTRMQALNRTGCPDDVMDAAVADWRAALADLVDAPPAQSAAGVRAKLLIAHAIHQDRVRKHFNLPLGVAERDEDLLIDGTLADVLAGGLG